MLEVIGTKLTMWIFNNMWFYTLIDIILLILIIVLFKKYIDLKKQVNHEGVDNTVKKSVFDKMPTIGIPKAPAAMPVAEEEVKTEAGVFDQILANQELANKQVMRQQTQVEMPVQQPIVEQPHYEIPEQQVVVQQPLNTAPVFEQNNIGSQVQPQAFEQTMAATQPVQQPDLSGYNIADSHLSQQVVEDQPFVTASLVQEQYNQAHEFKPFDASQIEFKPTPSYDEVLHGNEFASFNAQPEFQQPVTQFAEPAFSESNFGQEIKIEKEEFNPSSQQQYQPQPEFTQMNDNYVSPQEEPEEDIEEELKTLVQVKRHLIDKIKYYNGLIQQLELEPNGPEKDMKREEIATQLRRIKVEFEEYNEIEREVLEHAKNKVR